jgi:hypothetical protein
MAIHTPIADTEQPRRLVLVDFDWEDADLLPRLIKAPGAAVRLVAGERSDDAGVRLAELCGLPRTTDLADITREIFDLALVSERSPRRTQIEGLLLALGTPSQSPQAFLDGGTLEHTSPGVEAPIALHAAAFETTLGGGDFADIVEHALPDMVDGPTAPEPVEIRDTPRLAVASLDDFPSPEDRRHLEDALRDAMVETGAGRAELHMGSGENVEMVVEVGPDDALLKGLVALALELGTPQVVSQVAGVGQGRTWGAWPFRTSQRHGVLAAAAMPKQADWSTWERTLNDLRQSWDREDKARAGPAYPMLPDLEKRWLTMEEFTAQLELALERNRRDGMKFALHRLLFPASPNAVDVLAEGLPDQLRDTDRICRPSPQRVVLLTAGARDHFPHVRRRIMNLWQAAWLQVGNERPIPGITDERIEMTGLDDSEAFLARAAEWLAG